MVMKNTIGAALLFGLALATLLVLGNLVVRDAFADDGFTKIRVAPGLATSSNFIDVLLPFLSNHPETDEGQGEMALKVDKVDGAYRVEITKTGYLDDSVSGEVYRGNVIRTKDGQWELIEMVVKPICSRGKPKNGRCP